MDDVLGPYPSGRSGNDAFDVLISDVKPEDLPGRISVALQTPYLADMETRANPFNSIVFNTMDMKMRVLFTLPVSARGRSVATHFILVTGALLYKLRCQCWMHQSFQRYQCTARWSDSTG